MEKVRRDQVQKWVLNKQASIATVRTPQAVENTIVQFLDEFGFLATKSPPRLAPKRAAVAEPVSMSEQPEEDE